MSGLIVEDLGVTVDGRPLLSGLALEAPRGAITGVVGPNGAGKSTLLAAIMGQRRLRSGRIQFDGRDLPVMAAVDRARSVAFVEQSVSTAERLTVADVVALGRLPFQGGWLAGAQPVDLEIVADAIGRLGLSGLAARLYTTLSGGEQQRVQIARALAQRPHLLLLDEPVSHLDVRAQVLVLELLRQLATEGCTILVTLHDLNLAARYCDHLVVLRSGQVAASGAPPSVLSEQLLREVYGVEASILRPADRPYPVIAYEGPSRPLSGFDSD